MKGLSDEDVALVLPLADTGVVCSKRRVGG